MWITVEENKQKKTSEDRFNESNLIKKIKS